MMIQGTKVKKYIVLDRNNQDCLIVGTYDEIQQEFNSYPDTFLDDNIALEIYELGELQEVNLVRPAISFMSVTEKLQEIYNNTINQL